MICVTFERDYYLFVGFLFRTVKLACSLYMFETLISVLYVSGCMWGVLVKVSVSKTCSYSLFAIPFFIYVKKLSWSYMVQLNLNVCSTCFAYVRKREPPLTNDCNDRNPCTIHKMQHGKKGDTKRTFAFPKTTLSLCGVRI